MTTNSPSFTEETPQSPAGKTAPEGSQTAPPVVLNSADLFIGIREISIKHGEEFYRLRLTKSGKLILHK
ncbi:MAG TPA: hemin uptake protein HemP [Planctomicrobium sp.]|nr:hemin uptake protein HemP [Planctomicrobium sp.]